MFGLGDQGEPSSNKKTDVDANKSSDVFFPTVKAVFDWVSGLFAKGAASSTDNAIARFDGATGKVLQNSNVTITDAGNVGIGTISPSQKLDVVGHIQISNNLGSLFFRKSDLSGGASIGIAGDGTSFQVSGTGMIPIPSDTLPLGSNLNRWSAIRIGTGTSYIIGNVGIGSGATSPTAKLDVDGTSRFRNNATFNGQIIDNAGSSGTDGQVLKKVGGLVIWANP